MSGAVCLSSVVTTNIVVFSFTKTCHVLCRFKLLPTRGNQDPTLNGEQQTLKKMEETDVSVLRKTKPNCALHN